jgi:hypothetical protein
VPDVATATGEASGPSYHDLEFELSKVQEEELLLLLSNYQAHVKGRFRVNSCKLLSRTETGLTALCTLRFFTLPDAVAPPDKQ